MDKVLEDTGLHMPQVNTATHAVIGGHTDHPSVRVVVASQPNDGNFSMRVIPFLLYLQVLIICFLQLFYIIINPT